MARADIFLRKDGRGTLDEIAGQGVDVHLERIDNHLFSLTVTRANRRLVVTLGTPSTYRRNVYATLSSDSQNPASEVPHAT